MAYLLPIAFLAIVAGAIFALMQYFTSVRRSTSQLAGSLLAAGYRLVSSKQTFLNCGPFHSAGAFHQPVYRISATDSNGQLCFGWARWSAETAHFEFSWEQN